MRDRDAALDSAFAKSPQFSAMHSSGCCSPNRPTSQLTFWQPE